MAVARSFIRNAGTLYLICAGIGVATGFGAFLFSWCLDHAEGMLLHRYVEFNVTAPFSFGPFQPALFLLLAGGALVNGAIARFFAPEVRGSGIDFIIDRFHNHEGNMRGRVALYKTAATVAALATGASAGKEGPAAQIGAGIGSLAANRMRIGARARRTLLLAGAAGGLGAVFHAPLAGALTAVEMLYREDIESDALVPCIISSVSAFLVHSLLWKPGPLFAIAGLNFHFADLPFFLALGVLCFVCGLAFIRFYERAALGFARSRIPVLLRPLAGILLVACIASLVPQVTGSGSHVTGAILNSAVSLTWTAALWFMLVGFLKMLASSFTVGSGNSGGLYGPSLMMGACIGMAAGIGAGILLPGQTSAPAAYAMVGMGAFYSGVASAPIAGMLMVCELTGSYTLLPGMMVVTMTSLVLSHKWSIYRSQLQNRFQSPAHEWDIRADFLEKATVEGSGIPLRFFAVVSARSRLSQVRRVSARVNASDLIVCDGERYAGMISLKTYRGRMASRINPVRVPPVGPSDSLALALRVMTEFDMDKIAVVSAGRFIGYLRQRDVVAHYFRSR